MSKPAGKSEWHEYRYTPHTAGNYKKTGDFPYDLLFGPVGFKSARAVMGGIMDLRYSAGLIIPVLKPLFPQDGKK